MLKTVSGYSSLKISGLLTLNAVSSNGSVGTAGQFLTSNGTTTYWSTPAVASVNVNAQYVWTNTQTFSNTITFSSTINGTANNAAYLGGTAASGYQTTAGLSANVATLTSNNATNAFGKTEGNLNVNSATTALTANNSTNLGGTAAAGYQTTAGLSANVATLTANNSSNFGGQLPAYYTNATNITTGTLPYAQIPANVINTTAAFTRTGITTFSANVVLGSSGLSSNGGFGTAGEVLHSNGTATYWAADDQGVTSVATGNGMTGGTITATGTVSVLANTGIVANATGVFVNATYIGTLTSNNATNAFGKTEGALNVNNATTAYGKTEGALNVNSATTALTANNSTNLGGVAAASYVQNTDSRVLSGNLNFTGTNNFFSTGLFVGANVIANTTALAVGNSTVNAIYNSTLIQVANSTATANITAFGLSTGISVVNTTVVQVGTNNFINATALDIGNSVMTSTLLTLGGQVNANGGVGTAGQVLTSAAAGNVYWSSPQTPTTYDLLAITNTAVNEGRFRLKDSANANDDVLVTGTGAAVVSSNATHLIINATDTNTTYDLLAIANTVANEARFRLKDVNNSNDDVILVGANGITTFSNTTGGYAFAVGSSTVTVNTTGIHVNPSLSITNLELSGNLTVLGDTVTLNVASIAIEDSLVEYARNQNDTATFTDALDIGFYGSYGNTANSWSSGLFRDQSDSGVWKIFQSNGTVTNTNIDTASLFGLAPLRASSFGTTEAGYGSATGGAISNVTVIAVGNSTANVVAGYGTFNLNNNLIANSTGVYHTGTVNAASHTVGTNFIANSTAIVGTGFANVTTSVNSALLTVGTNFIANTIGAYHTGTINAASYTVGALFTANSTVVNAVSYYAGTLLVANSTVSNATHLGGTAASGYQTTAGLSANVATLTSNNSTNFGGQLPAYYTNATNITTGTLPYAQIPANVINTTAAFTRTGITTFSANIVLGSSGVSANGGFGAAGEVLHSNGTATYWATDDQGAGVTSVATGNGMTGGTITATGTVSVLANTGIVANATGLFVNATYIGTLTSNNATNAFGKTEGALNVNNATTAYGKAEGALNVNSASTALTANNSTNLGGTAAASYQLNSTLSANVATLTSNNSTNFGGQLPAYYTNATNITTGTLPYAQIPANVINTTAAFTRTGITTFSANVVLGSSGFSANGSFGTDTHVLHSNGTATYWAADDQGVTSVATGNGMTGGTISTTGTVSVLANTGIVANATGVFVNATYIGTLTSNNATNAFGKTEGALNVNNATTAYGKAEGALNVNSATTALTANNASFLGTVAAASYVQNTDSRVLSGNLNFTGTNNFFSTGLFVGANVIANTTALAVGNSTANSTTNATAVTAHIQHASRPTLGFNYTVANTVNSLIVGPYAVNTGFTLTVETGARLVIV